MSIFLRAEMLFLASAVCLLVFRAIRKKRLLVRFSLIWLLIAAGMVLSALCPGAVAWACGAAHIEKPSNFIYLLGLVTLLGLSFGQTLLLSRQSEQIRRLTQALSLEQSDRAAGKEDGDVR